MDMRSHTLFAADGVRLEAGHLPAGHLLPGHLPAGHPAAGDGLCMVLAHGFTGSWRQPAHRRIARALHRYGGVLTLDFRGHGRSGGLSTVGDLEVLDLEAAVRFARGLGYRRVAVVGFSMGGAVAVRHAALHGGVDAVVSVSAPARWYYRGTAPMRQVHWAIERPSGRLVTRLVRRTRIAAQGWDPVPEAPYEVAGRISPVPLLVVHGDADRYFPVEHAEQLYGAARDPRELWIEPAFGHAEVAATPSLILRIGDWAAARSLS